MAIDPTRTAFVSLTRRFTYAHAIPAESGLSAIPVEDYLPLVRKIAGRMSRRFRALRPPVVFEDLVSDGAEGLLQAARRFDPTLGVKFTTYAHCRIEGAILDGVRRSGWYSRRDYELYREGREPPVWIVRYEAADHALSRVADPAASAEKLADDFRQRRMLADAIRSLPKRERRFVEGYFYDGLLLDDLGAEIGRSKSWTCRLLARALRRLRERLAPAQP